MLNNFRKIYYKLRRKLGIILVPEFVWPKQIKVDNTSIPVRGMPYLFGIKRMLLSGVYESSERELIKNIVKKGDKIIEFGGSIGIITAIVSQVIAEDGFIVSVEASGKLTNTSKKWLEKKGNVKILTGIGFPIWEVPLTYQNFDFVENEDSLVGSVNFSQNLSSKKYRMYNLKSIEEEYKLNANILIIDIEGTEIIFQEQDIIIPKTIQDIILETHPSIYGDDIKRNIINKLKNHGFNEKREIKDVFWLSRN